MPWLRIGDTVTTHPGYFRLLEVCDGDHALKNEAWGFLVLAASISAAHTTDYIISRGLAGTLAPGRVETLATALIAAELMEPVEVDGRSMFKIADDEDLIHMRTAEEVELDRARKRDHRKPDLTIPVRVRDGDQCRWCDKTVNFADHKSARGGTIDSLTGHKNSTVDTLVVACRGCNSARSSGKDLTLIKAPTPQEVYYRDSTIAYINNHDWAKENNIRLTPRQLRLDLPAQAAATQAADPTHRGATAPDQAAPAPSTPQPAGPRDDLADAPDWVTAPIEEIFPTRQAAAPAAPDHKDIDDQAAATTAAPTDQAAALTAAPAPGARGQQAPDTEILTAQAAAPAAPAPEDNETIKPNAESNTDPSHEGDRSSLSGSGLVGTGRGSSVLHVPEPGRKRRRGRRSGRKR